MTTNKSEMVYARFWKRARGGLFVATLWMERTLYKKALDLRPDVILVDVSMPGLNGFEAAVCIHEQIPSVEILIVTEHDAGTVEHLPPQPGIRGYVVKSRLEDDLIPAVEAASKHQPVSNSAVA